MDQSVDAKDPPGIDELNDDNGGYPAGSPVSSQNSIDLLAKEYDEMTLTDSSDEEPEVHGNDKKVRRHAKKFARGYLEIKKDSEKQKVKHASHLAFAEALQNERNDLIRELAHCQLKTQNDERETGKLKERIRQLEAMGDMLQYGTQGKCGVCSKTSKIIDSHPYSMQGSFGNMQSSEQIILEFSIYSRSANCNQVAADGSICVVNVTTPQELKKKGSRTISSLCWRVAKL